MAICEVCGCTYSPLLDWDDEGDTCGECLNDAERDDDGDDDDDTPHMSMNEIDAAIATATPEQLAKLLTIGQSPDEEAAALYDRCERLEAEVDELEQKMAQAVAEGRRMTDVLRALN